MSYHNLKSVIPASLKVSSRSALKESLKKEKEFIVVLENDLDRKKEELSVQKVVSDNLFEHVTKRLDNAVESKDFVWVQVAKTILDAAKAQRKKEKRLKVRHSKGQIDC